MISDSRTSSPQSSSKDGSSALDHDAKHVEDITQSQDRSRERDQSNQAKNGQTSHAAQDAQVQTITRQAKEAGAGATETDENLNQDG